MPTYEEVRDGGALDYYIREYRRCVGTQSKSCHADTLRNLERNYGAGNAVSATPSQLARIQQEAKDSITRGQIYRSRSASYKLTNWGNPNRPIAGHNYRWEVQVTVNVTVGGRIVGTETRLVSLVGTEDRTRQELEDAAAQQALDRVAKDLRTSPKYGEDEPELTTLTTRIESAYRTPKMKGP